MEEYIAFISYRHRPIDIAVAERLHKLIERYRIPKALRADGKKTLGKVFRDKDELSLDQDLSQRLRDALDASRYLIVICTPDTPDSGWVAEEIRYFRQNHDDSCVFTVLADGDPERSFPQPLTQVFDGQGNVIEGVECQPLAAEIAADTDRERARKLDREFLRLVAPMLGCSYDTLYQREARYRRRRRTAAGSAAAAVAAVFMTVVTLKNAQINRQFLQTQINESNALAKISLQELKDGNAFGALKTAFSASPAADGRPYTMDTQIALAKSLYAYQPMDYRPDVTVTQWSTVKQAVFSADGKMLFTLDDFNNINAFNALNGELLWTAGNGTEVNYVERKIGLFADGSAVVYMGHEHAAVFDSKTGERLRTVTYSDVTVEERKTYGLCSDYALSPDGYTLACGQEFINAEGDTRWRHVVFYDLRDGTHRVSEALPGLSWDSFYKGGGFSGDGDTCLVVYDKTETVEEKETRSTYFYLLDTKSGKILNARYHGDTASIGDVKVFPLGEDGARGDGFIAMVYYNKKGNWTADYTAVYSAYEKEEKVMKFDQTVPAGDFPYALCFQGEEDVFLFCGKYHVRLDLKHYLLTFGEYPEETVGAHFVDEKHIYALLSDGRRTWREHSDAVWKDKFDTYSNASVAAAFGTFRQGDPFCVVPADNTNTLCIYRMQGDTNGRTLPLPDFVDPEQSMGWGSVYALPDNESVLYFFTVFIKDSEMYDHKGAIYNILTGEIVKSFSFQGDYTFNDPEGFSPDGSRIYSIRGAYDINSGEVLTDKAEQFRFQYMTTISADSAQMNDGTERSYAYEGYNCVYWWRFGEAPSEVPLPEGKLPADLPNSDILIDECVEEHEVRIGGSGVIAFPYETEERKEEICGYLMYSVSDGRLNETVLKAEGQDRPLAYTAGDKQQWLAVAEPDSVMRIYDMKHKEPIKEFPMLIPYNSIVEIRFIMDDSVLMIHQSSADKESGHRVWLMDTSDGSILQAIELKEPEKTTNQFVDLQVQWDKERNLLSLCDAQHFLPVSYVLDTESWSVLYELPKGCACLPECGKVLQWSEDGYELICTPLYTMDELEEWAQRKLEEKQEPID